MASDRIVSLLGNQADYLLQHECTKVRRGDIHLPSPNFVDDYFGPSNRNNPTLRALSTLHHFFYNAVPLLAGAALTAPLRVIRPAGLANKSFFYLGHGSDQGTQRAWLSRF